MTCSADVQRGIPSALAYCCPVHIEPMTKDAPEPKPNAKIDPRWWSLGVVDGFHGVRSQYAVADRLSYDSGHVEGQAAKARGRSIDEVLQKFGVPYREVHFRRAPLRGRSRTRGR